MKAAPTLLSGAFLVLIFLLQAHAHSTSPAKTPPVKVFDVTKYGALGDGQVHIVDDEACENALAFGRAFSEACSHKGPAKVLVPPGKFVTSHVGFWGKFNCTSPSIVVEIQGNVTLNPDPTLLVNPEWFWICQVNHLTITGSGTIDATATDTDISYLNPACKEDISCLASCSGTFAIYNSTNVVVENLNLINSKCFNIHIQYSKDITVRGVTLSSPAYRPTTDGLRIQESESVTVANSVIGSGDDCISMDVGSSKINITGITCGPGHGISIGPIGRHFDELDVKGVTVRNCTFLETTEGVSIRTVPGKSYRPIQASEIVFEDLVMDKVHNPIVIDQHFSKLLPKPKGESEVKIKDIQFRKIRGTATSNSIIKFDCSKTFPCEGIKVVDVQVKPSSCGPKKKSPPAGPSCLNAKVTFEGNNLGLAC